MTQRMARAARSARSGERMVVTGDLNVARGEADLKNWKGNLRKAGFLVGERARLDARLTDAWVGRASAYAARWSDHAPVVVDYDV